MQERYDEPIEIHLKEPYIYYNHTYDNERCMEDHCCRCDEVESLREEFTNLARIVILLCENNGIELRYNSNGDLKDKKWNLMNS